MFEKIMYPIDFSEVSRKAIPYLKKLKSAGTKQIVLLRVIDERKVECISRGIAWAGAEVADFLQQTTQWLKEEAEKEMDSLKTEFEKEGFDVHARVEVGSPYSKIVDIAEEEDVSAIILGSHGRNNLYSTLLGSVSDYVIRHCKRPVIVIKR
jgi:nucleotide-binding universal stress UspA family protein